MSEVCNLIQFDPTLVKFSEYSIFGGPFVAVETLKLDEIWPICPQALGHHFQSLSRTHETLARQLASHRELGTLIQRQAAGGDIWRYVRLPANWMMFSMILSLGINWIHLIQPNISGKAGAAGVSEEM